MSIKILMPALSPTMKDGILQKWFVKVGDKIKAGDLIAEIETDKASMEIEAVDEGVISEILVKEGTKGVQVNATIAIINGKKEENLKKIDLNKNELKNKNLNPNISHPSHENLKKNKKNITSGNINLFDKKDKIIASPFSKKFAKDNKINLELISGTGPEGRIIKRDINNINLKNNNIIESEKNTITEASSIRKIIAEKTTKTKNSVPHFYLTVESNVDKLLKLRENINKNNLDKKISINDILVKALALAQQNNPATNVSWDNGKIIKYSNVDVSFAVALKEGLITPIIKNADKKGLIEISNEIKVLTKKSKNNSLTPDEYNGGTISISNLGMFGIDEFKAIINTPQSCILAVGIIKKIPIVKNNQIVISNILKSTLSADHRVLDGAVAAKLLKDFNEIIENPFNIWLNSDDMEII